MSTWYDIGRVRTALMKRGIAVPGLNLQRLSAGIQTVHGNLALLAKMFMDVLRFADACYRAPRWRRPGCAACSSVWERCPGIAMPGASAIR